MVYNLTEKIYIIDTKELAANFIPTGICPLQTLPTFFIREMIFF